MNDKKEDLCIYRIRNAVETLGVAVLCYSINRSYYAAFYAIKAVLALEEIDFKRHKDAVAYFNNCSKNSLTSIGDGMNCTFEHVCSNS